MDSYGILWRRVSTGHLPWYGIIIISYLHIHAGHKHIHDSLYNQVTTIFSSQLKVVA